MKKSKPENSPEKLLDRRTVLTGLVAGAAGGAAGMAIGYQHHDNLEVLKDEISGAGSGRFDFHMRSRAIRRAHNQQTPEKISSLKRKYKKQSGSREQVWTLIEKMSQCIDLTDPTLYCTSQLVHIQQILAEMDAKGVDDPDMHLIALLHDLGKVSYLNGEQPENVFGKAARIGEYEHGIGLDKVLFQFSHAEIIYLRVKDLVPDHVAWSLRYHNIKFKDAAPYMNDRDRRHARNYLSPFRRFDNPTKSAFRVPEIDMSPYRQLIEKTFMNPIYF